MRISNDLCLEVGDGDIVGTQKVQCGLGRKMDVFCPEAGFTATAGGRPATANRQERGVARRRRNFCSVKGQYLKGEE